MENSKNNTTNKLNASALGVNQDKKKSKLDSKKADDLKEKTYITKQVDTSITLLDSQENDIVLEALLFLSKYADIKKNNLDYLQQQGILTKLLNLLNKNICILRLSLRFLNILLENEDLIIEFDQAIYDDKIKAISELFINHSDIHVRQFAAFILSKLATSCRITCLIFKIELFKPIFQLLKTSKDCDLLTGTLSYLYALINAPAALGMLATLEHFDTNVLLGFLKSPFPEIVTLIYKLLIRLSGYNIPIFQMLFKKHKLVEAMLVVVMDPDKKDYHQYALQFIQNCLNSAETNSYFIQSLEFLSFCQWAKSCPEVYILPSAIIFQKLSKITSIKQTLFDLSVEDTILFFLRSYDRDVLNSACEAISNMSVHRYCCEHMLTYPVLKILLQMMARDDQINENALKAVSNFCRRSPKTIEMIKELGLEQIIIHSFKKGPNNMSEDSFLRILDIIFRFAIHPEHQKIFVNETFFEDLLKIIQKESDSLAALTTEMLTYFVDSQRFINAFVGVNGPNLILDKLVVTTDQRLFKHLLIFIHCSLVDSNIIKEYIKQGMVPILQKLPEPLKSRSPIIERILSLSFDIHLPLKFFHFGKLDIGETLTNQFYIINGPWKSEFPFLEVIMSQQICPRFPLYIVDYSYEVCDSNELETARFVFEKDTSADGLTQSDSQTIRKSSKLLPASKRSLTRQSRKSSILSDSRGSISILKQSDSFFEELPPDPFLPKYIHRMKRKTEGLPLEEKIQILAKYVDSLLCGPTGDDSVHGQVQTFAYHMQALRMKLGNFLIPVGYLRIGFHCERALLFKAIADKLCVPCSFIKGTSKIYWNEVALFSEENGDCIQFYVVDLMKNVGDLLPVGSRAANIYCNIESL